MGLVCLLVSCSTDETTDNSTTANFESELSIENNDAMSSEILSIINTYRATIDLPPFSSHILAKEDAIDHTG
jgi:hypothetical protein